MGRMRAAGAALVEFAIGMILLVLMLGGFRVYFNVYLQQDEELIARQLLSLGRLNVIPPLLTHSTQGDCVIDSSTLAAALSLFIRNSFVTRDVAVNAGACVAQADFRSFFVLFNNQYQTGTVLGSQNDGGGNPIGEVYRCDGDVEVAVGGVFSAPLDARVTALRQMVDANYYQGDAEAGFPSQTYLVVFSNKQPNLPAFVRSVNVGACLAPAVHEELRRVDEAL